MGLEDISTLDGGQAQFTAKIVGVPQPEITWYKEEDVIFSSEVFEIIQDDENNFILFIHDVMPEDAGRYSIVAKNEMGTATSSAQLTVTGKYKVSFQSHVHGCVHTCMHWLVDVHLHMCWPAWSLAHMSTCMVVINTEISLINYCLKRVNPQFIGKE